MMKRKHLRYRRIQRGAGHGPDALELLAAAFVALTTLSLVAGFSIHLVRLAQVSEAVMLARGAVPDLIEFRSVHGYWPRTAASPQGTVISSLRSGQGSYTRSLELEPGGGLVARLMLTRPRGFWSMEHGHVDAALSLRPAVIGAAGFQSVIFLCGNSPPPSGVKRLEAANRTTLSTDDLPPTCRRGYE